MRFGCYYSWGEWERYISDGTWDSYIYGDNDYWADTYTLYKYNTKTRYGTVDNKTVLEAMDDAATQWLGGGARIPTAYEWQELLDNTTGEWTQQNGMNGRKFTAANGCSLFLPAEGFKCNGFNEYYGTVGSYWSASLHELDPYFAWFVYFDSNVQYMNSNGYRSYGRSVRAVRSRN